MFSLTEIKPIKATPQRVMNSYLRVHVAPENKLPRLYLEEDGQSNLGTFFCHIRYGKNSNLDVSDENLKTR